MPGLTKTRSRTKAPAQRNRKPLPVWQAHASALLPVLLAGLPYARPEAATAMKEEIQEIIGDGQLANLPRRPCLILASDPAADTFGVVVFTTLEGGRVQLFELHEHFRHWLVAVGRATPSPLVGDFVLETEPAWSTTPQWAVACVVRLHHSQLNGRWKDNDCAVVSCSKTMVDNLLVNVQYRMRTYSSRSPQQCLAWDHSYLAHRESLSLARPSPSMPQQQLAATQPRPAASHGRSYSAPAALQVHALGAYHAELQQQHRRLRGTRQQRKRPRGLAQRRRCTEVFLPLARVRRTFSQHAQATVLRMVQPSESSTRRRPRRGMRTPASVRTDAAVEITSTKRTVTQEAWQSRSTLDLPRSSIPVGHHVQSSNNLEPPQRSHAPLPPPEGSATAASSAPEGQGNGNDPNGRGRHLPKVLACSGGK